MSQYALGLVCVNCGAQFPLQEMFEGCTECVSPKFRSGLTVAYDYEALHGKIGRNLFSSVGEGVWKYRELLPINKPVNEITLNEGNTPLVTFPQWAQQLGLKAVYIKDESRNPTWSFKDRLCSVAVSKALDFDRHTVAVSTSGNHGASTAAYAARAGLSCVVFTYPGISSTMRLLIQIYGAYLYVSSFEGRWKLLQEGMDRYGWYPMGNITDIPTCNPYGHEGYKSIAYEIYEQLDWQIPDVVIIPSGYSEGLYGVWKGFRELKLLGFTDKTPRMVAVEPERRAALNKAYSQGGEAIITVNADSTAARGIGSRINSFIGYSALKESSGLAVSVSDDDVLAAQAALGRSGVYCEPASAASVAGMRKIIKRGELTRDQVVVCINTSSGLKNSVVPSDSMPPIPEIEPVFSTFLAASREYYALGEGKSPLVLPDN